MASNLLEQIHFLGNDQVASQFDVLFLRGLPGLPLDPRLLQFRVTEDFQIPTDKLATKEIFSRGKKIIKVYPKEDFEKRLNFSFRLDGKWLIYNAFKRYMNQMFNPKSLSSSKDQKELKTEITFIAKSPGNKKLFIFKKCVIESIELSPFNHSNADPVICKIVFNYLEMEDELSLLGF